MKTAFLCLILSLSAVAQSGHDTVTVKHRLYTTTYDTALHYPVHVEWLLTREMMSCPQKLARTNKFVPDPLLAKWTNVNADYRQGGEDRGHNMPAEDNACDSVGETECFYFSNMTPQIARLNRGDWKELETYTRKVALQEDSVYVECGSYGFVRKMGKVSVPAACWKILKVKKTGAVEAYLFRNDGSSEPLPQHATTVDSLEKLTGLDLK